MRHPEVEASTYRIVETVQDHDMWVKGVRGELKALRFYSDLHIRLKYFLVVYRELREEKVTMTAYFTSTAAEVRGEIT